jgi:hypothetical protein
MSRHHWTSELPHTRVQREGMVLTSVILECLLFSVADCAWIWHASTRGNMDSMRTIVCLRDASCNSDPTNITVGDISRLSDFDLLLFYTKQHHRGRHCERSTSTQRIHPYKSPHIDASTSSMSGRRTRSMRCYEGRKPRAWRG